MDVDACVWQFGVDYPGSEGDDSKLPIMTVSLKAWDETYWMSTFDRHPSAISGPDSIAKAVKVFGDQGIGLFLWCVPKGRNVAKMIDLSLKCLDVPGVKGLIYDVEPWSGFCGPDCTFLAQNLARRVRELRPNAWLGAHYDPRPQHRVPSGLTEWFKYIDAAMPMVYWRSFAGQSPWDDPARSVTMAAELLRDLGFGGEYFPILQGNAPAAEVVEAALAAGAHGARRVSLWRRGVVRAATWSALADLTGITGPAPPEPEPEPEPEEELTVGQYEELKARIEHEAQLALERVNAAKQEARSFSQLQVHDPIVRRLVADEARIAALESRPPAPAQPAPTFINVKSYTVRSGDTASGIAAKHGMSWNAFVALNPQGPPSGDWNRIYKGERYLVT